MLFLVLSLLVLIHSRQTNAYENVTIKQVYTPSFGEFVGVSADGRTILISGQGQLFVYDYLTSNSSYTSSPAISHTGAYELGYRCGISGDGNFIIAGVDNPGSGFIYEKLSNGTWAEVFATSNPSYPQVVGIDYHGMTAVACIGGSLNSYIYSRNTTTNTWSTASILVPCFHSGSFSADGRTLVGGDSTFNNNQGVGHVSTSNAGNWNTIQVSPPAEAIGPSRFGGGSCVNYDGSVIAIGADNDNNGNGAIYVYTNGLKNSVKLNVSQPGVAFGSICRLNYQGNVLVVGCGNSPTAIVYYNNGTDWSYVASLSLGLLAEASTLAVSADGTVIVSGAYKSNSVVIWQNVVNVNSGTTSSNSTNNTTGNHTNSPTFAPSSAYYFGNRLGILGLTFAFVFVVFT